MGVVGIYLYATASTTPTLLQVSSMHQLLSLPNTQAPTMSSREIATLCDKRHDNVMADIRKMFAELDMNAPEFSGTFTTEQGNTYECFNLPKRECLILVSGYSLILRTKIIDRWAELEARLPQVTLPQTFADALRAYADEVEAHEATKQELAIAAPKADYFDGLVERNLLVNFTTFAKEIGVKRKLVIAYMLENGYLYRDQHNNLLPYAEYTPTLFEVKEYDKGKHAGVQTLLTPKGRETFRLLLG